MTKDFFAFNRRHLASLGSNDRLVVFTAYSAMQRKGDASFAFEQEANFWYLTGIEEPDWLLVIEGKRSTLIAPNLSDVHQLFDGGLSAKSALKISGVDKVIDQKEGERLLKTLAEKYKTVATLGSDPRAKYYNFVSNPALEKLLRKLKKLFGEVKDCRHDLAVLRAIKQPEEIDAMQRAIDLTARSFERVKKLLPTQTYEYETEAEFTYDFRKSGAAGHAYDPIVAMGQNACTLHYVENSAKLERGLLLIDIGARLDGYAADITRTYAIGEPTSRERQVHGAVAKAQREIIDLLKPRLSVADYHDQVDVIMKKALDSLGLLKNEKDYRRYFPHAISHGLGIDVHDALGAPTEFLPGMVLTVEPGIYIPEESIGVRIEDDILITDTGHRNLSADLSVDL